MPTTPVSYTHLDVYKRQDLTPATIEANKRFFDGNEDLVPKQAYTMGIRTIMQARKVRCV